ncbi:hypothetical protein JCM10212_004629 [Sporobolomyces blumeae]
MDPSPPLPLIETHALPLDLGHSLVPFPLVAHVSVLSRESLLLFVGGSPVDPSISAMRDSAIAMPNPLGKGPCASTALSINSNLSKSLSSRLAKRYSIQLVVSLDLATVSDLVGGSSLDPVVFALEKALVQQLDRVVPPRRR